MTDLSQLMSLKGRRALITGAAGHLGRTMAETLAEQGADLILVDRPHTEYGAWLDLLKSRWQTNPTIIACDLESEADRDRLISETIADERGIEILINNAAFTGDSNLAGWVTSFSDQSIDVWRRAIEVNLTAAFHLCRDLAPSLGRNNQGSIINVASIYAHLGPDYDLYEGTAMGNPAAYGTAKGGLIQFTRWLSTTLAPSIRANVLSPGGIFRNQPASFVAKYQARTPLRRMATEEDFKGAVAYLASDLSAYVTGQNLCIDGGWGVW